MSDDMTTIFLPTLRRGAGLADWGEKSAVEMIRQYRSHAEMQKHEAEAILAAPDSAFQIEVVRGPLAQYNLRTIQKPIRGGENHE